MKLNYKTFLRKAKYYKTWFFAFQYGSGARLYVYEFLYRNGQRETVVQPCLLCDSTMTFDPRLNSCLVTCIVSSDVRYQTEYRHFVNFLLSCSVQQKHYLARLYGDPDFYLIFSDYTYPYESR